ncbi:TetR/AcrR family transcriptional regulator [Streptomyces sp. NPDC048643]|uniref:TetR/AcrR family transcriptional regulator n=1 Tax=Streptomyces sp. NPDC048643 TaxID=3155637 RepID=UPI00342EC01D
MTRQERAVRTREALIEAAAHLFDRDGYEVTSLAAVTAKAQVSAGALYFHFATKADLANAVTHTALTRLRQITGAPTATPASGNKSASASGDGNASGSGNGNGNGNGSGSGNGSGGGDGSGSGGGGGGAYTAAGADGERAAGPGPGVLGPALGAANGVGGDRGPDRVGELQQLIDTTHVFVRGLAGDVVLRAGFGLDGVRGERPVREHPAEEGPVGPGSAGRRPGGERPGRWPEVGGGLRGVWSGWVHETLTAAGTRGALTPGVSAGDAAAVVVAATVGFEVLGTQDPLWLAPERLTRLWTLLLPALVPPPVREALEAGGSAAVR